MATGTKSQKSASAQQSQQSTRPFLGGYVDPTNGTVRLTTDESKLQQLRLEVCANTRW